MPIPAAPRARLAAALAAAGMVLAGCSSAAAVDVRAVATEAGVTEADLPPRDAFLAEASWPIAAGFVAREAGLGRPVVVNLFGAWCEPCKAEAPMLRAAVEANPEITFLFVDTRDGRLLGQRFLEDFGLADQPSLFDPDSLVYEGLGARGMPTTAFFAADGTLVDVVHGILTEATLAQRLADLRATVADAAPPTRG